MEAFVNILLQVGGAADACGPTCETDSSVRFNLQNCNIILSKNFMCGNCCIVTNMLSWSDLNIEFKFSDLSQLAP